VLNFRAMRKQSACNHTKSKDDDEDGQELSHTRSADLKPAARTLILHFLSTVPCWQQRLLLASSRMMLLTLVTLEWQLKFTMFGRTCP